MIQPRPFLISLVCVLGLPASASAERAERAEPAEQAGQVNLPRSVYDAMLAASQASTSTLTPAPARYSLGAGKAEVTVQDANGGFTAEVDLEFGLRVHEDGWVAIPLLAAGSAVSSVQIDGTAAELVTTAAGLSWVTQDVGPHQVQLSYSVDVRGGPHGASVAIPTPQLADLTFEASLPGTELDVALLPAAGVTTREQGSGTTVTATVPSTGAVQLSWRAPGEGGHELSQAKYRGSLERDAVRWTAELSVELFDDDGVVVPLLPRSVTLRELKVDHEPASIVLDDTHFAARIKGRGVHHVQLGFEVPIVRDEGPPRVELQLPEVPVSELELSLPADKELVLEPAAQVRTEQRGALRVAHAFLPLTETLTLSWPDAVPDAATEELLANANIHHLVHAEEGVLYVHALVVYEVTGGRTNVLELDVPADVQVSDIGGAEGRVKQAIPERGKGQDKSTRYRIFFDHELEGAVTVDLFYERKLPAGDQADSTLTVPVVRAVGVSRQRGMLALLSSKELTLEPDPASEEHVTRVGENQLPHFVREVVDKTIAHTYKYLETAPSLRVRPAPPQRSAGKFDAEVDTLVSLGDVTMKGAASVAIHVKRGTLDGLTLLLPAGVNLLGLTAPSLRNHELRDPDASGRQPIEVHFTQEMEGQFRLEVSYEKIASEGETLVEVPTLNVQGAEVEQGRVAIEALSAVEVSEATRDHLSPLDPNELPQQLVLKTTNPILRAYKYVQVEPPYRLQLAVARHREVTLQQATVDEAHYRTLYTADGLSVTTATFTVRNSREQFLKVRLPSGSKIWSAFVAGRAERPALDEAKDGHPIVLVKIINSTEGFPVELIYETPVAQLGSLGRIQGELPAPQMVVTHTRWEVYLPEGLQYGEPTTNLDPQAQAEPIARAEMAGALAAEHASGSSAEPLRIEVPAAGVRYAFSKLYANRAAEAARFSLPYSSRGGAWLARLLALAGTGLFWAGLFLLVWGGRRRVGLALSVGGGALVLAALSAVGVSAAWPLVASLLGLVAVGLRWVMTQRPGASTLHGAEPR
jgi:hypothetical protein